MDWLWPSWVGDLKLNMGPLLSFLLVKQRGKAALFLEQHCLAEQPTRQE